ncbi:hypothetical protein DFH06DRAFT_1393277 [Mycena polygramma]|nr:hypothetical protein DFH06DRAFT_1393277 [Mycena polygramma]
MRLYLRAAPDKMSHPETLVCSSPILYWQAILKETGRIPKLHARMRIDFPAWTVREKHMRKALAALAPPKDTTPPHPSSQLVNGLDIASRQELLITYVNPAAGYATHRTGLGFVCRYARCVEEGREWMPLEAPEGLSNLASELKAGFGVM